MNGRVVLVGAGPGDPDLLTVRAVRELGRAEVLLYDALVDPVLLELASPDCELIDVGKRGDGSRGVSQDAIAGLLVEHARAGRYVVRLKGGDPFVFGRGGEEAAALHEAGLPFEIVPGISSAIAVPAYAGIPVTDRRLSSSVAVVTGHRGKEATDRRIDWEGLARSAETLVILMGTAWLPDIVARVLSAGRDPDTPAAVISEGATPRQRVVSAPLHALPESVREAGLRSPAVIVIGPVAASRETLAWYEARPLFGRRVLVPRAEGQAGELALALRRRAAEPLLVPLLEFVPPEDPDALAGALRAAPESDWLVFTSANAVRACAAGLRDVDPLALRVACIGNATAAAARHAGLGVDRLPLRALPEDLAAALGDVHGRRVLFPHAENARDTLPAALELAGANVVRVIAYRTRVPEGAGAAVRAVLKDGVDAVTFTSPSTVEHFFGLLEASERESALATARIACIGPTTAEALARFVAEPAKGNVVADQQSSEGLADALERAFAEDRDGVS